MSKLQERWEKTVEAMSKDIEGFNYDKKQDVLIQRILCKILSPFKYKDVYTALYPTVYLPVTDDINRIYNYRAYQHEWVHFKDNETLMKLSSKKLKWINISLFSILYAVPQIFAILSLLAIWGSLWWLLCLLFLLPLPAPFRWYAEIRAYRRSVELGSDPKLIAKGLASSKYYFCMPIKSLTEKMLSNKSSPYKEEMDKVF